jgi:PAS domain S-box-containing protein
VPLAIRARQLGLVTLFSAGYFACVLAGHALSFESLSLPAQTFATFWPAAGLFTATLALTPRSRWWPYLLATAVINLLTEIGIFQQTVNWSLALIFMSANGLEALVGALLLQWSAGGTFQFAKIRHVLALAAISLAAPLVGAFIGAWGLAAETPTESFGRYFLLWWQADSVGILLVAPVQIALASRLLRLDPGRAANGWLRAVEAVALYSSLNVVAWLAFSPFSDSLVWSLCGLLYLVPGLAWAGLRFSRLGAAAASSLVVMITIYHTTRGDGLFALASAEPEWQAMSLQTVSLVTMLTPLLFATVIDAQRGAEEKLRYNLSILQSVLDNTTDLIYVKDLQGRYLLVNQACARTTNLPVEQIMGRRDVEIVPAEIADRVRQRDQLVYAAGHPLTYEETSYLDGRQYTFLTTKSPYRDANGEVVGLVGLSRDISQRIREVNALAESERRYRTLVNSSNVGIFETDATGARLFLNPRWSELTGYAAEAGAGEGWLQCLHPDDREPVNSAFLAAIATGRTFAMEYRYLTPSGDITWVYGTAQPIRDEQDQVTGYLGNVIDISDQKRAVLELQLSEERFRRLADSAPVLIWTTTLEARNSYCNRKWLEFTGRTQEQEQDHGWLDGIHPEDRDRCVQAYAAAEAGSLPGVPGTPGKEPGAIAFQIEYRLRRHDGEYRWMHHDGVPKTSGSGEFRGFIGSCFDITDQRRATETLLRAKEELEQHVAERTAELQQANRQLQQLLLEQARAEERLQRQQTDLAHVSRLSVMGEMAAGLAHELTLPLFAIQNYTAGILRRWSGPADCSPELREIIQQIAQESTRAAVIIRRVREFARKQLGERNPLPLNLVVKEVLQLLGSDLRRQKIDVRLSLAEDLPPAPLDRVQIQQVLVNLIRNALEAMETLPPPLRQLTISTYQSSSAVHCLVQDSGPGIDREVRQRLFEPFFTTKREGLGMGLSISRSIVEAHGGALTSESPADSANGGAAFHFHIPLQEEAVHDLRTEHADRVLGR